MAVSFSYNSSRLAVNITTATGQKKPPYTEAHHIIPGSLFKDSGVREAFKTYASESPRLKFNLDDASNGIFLPQNDPALLPIHRKEGGGLHVGYTKVLAIIYLTNPRK